MQELDKFDFLKNTSFYSIIKCYIYSLCSLINSKTIYLNTNTKSINKFSSFTLSYVNENCPLTIRY